MRKILWLLFFSFSLFFTNNAAEAAEVLQSGGIGANLSGPKITKSSVRYDIVSDVEVTYIRHTKYTTSEWEIPTAYKQLKSYKNQKISAFAYTCPGYYMTRLYADREGTQLIGWVRVYVSTAELNKSGCDSILDTTKNTPSDSATFNVTHPYEIVVEPSKMIRNDVSIESSNPIVRDNVDEDFVQFNDKVDSDALSAEKACRQKAANTGLSYQLKYNSNTSSWECVVTSDCMYNSSLWHCNAPTVAQKYSNVTTVVDTPSRSLFDEHQCTYAYAIKCANLYDPPITDYSPPVDYLDFVEVTDVRPEDTTPTFPSDPTGNYNTHDPNVVPPTPIGESCWNSDGTPNFGVEGCMWNCDDPYMQQYSYCAGKGQQPQEPYVEPIYPEEPYVEPIYPEEPYVEPTYPEGEIALEKPSCYCEQLDQYGAGLGYMCCVWDCPGLDQKINEAKGFLLNDLVGTVQAPSVPEFDAPSIPNIFDVLNDVDKREPEPITTEEDTGLKNATFNADDIKNEAEELPFRDDPTGGFNIVNPLETLPEDGSSAPRPKEELGSLPYPGAGGNIEGERTPGSSQSGGNKVTYPQYSDKAEPPQYSDQVGPPQYSDQVKIPVGGG